MNGYSLTRVQILKLAKLAEKFPDVVWFSFEDGISNGIGPTTYVKLNLFGDAEKDLDTTIDITDTSTW